MRTASSYSGVELSNPLVELARCSKWNQVVSLSSPLSLSGLTEDTVTTLAYRFEALFRLRQYDELLGELSSVQQAVGSAQDKLDLRCSLVLLQCEAQLLCGRSSDALCALQSLHTELESREGGEGGRVLFWRLQCLSQRANALVRLRQWRGAVCLARDLSLLVLREAHQLPKGEQGVVAGLQASLLLHLSKLLLQV
ncbi:hypothetical protein EON64_10830 [archaeon]|nr:MAG: hypothetical protein EON64_10830 [archaeon]